MYEKSDYKKNDQANFQDIFNSIEQTIFSIRQTINCIKASPLKIEKNEQFLFDDIYGLLKSLNYMLYFNYHHAQSQEEVIDIWKMQEMINNTCTEFQPLHPISIN